MFSHWTGKKLVSAKDGDNTSSGEEGEHRPPARSDRRESSPERPWDIPIPCKPMAPYKEPAKHDEDLDGKAGSLVLCQEDP